MRPQSGTVAAAAAVGLTPHWGAQSSKPGPPEPLAGSFLARQSQVWNSTDGRNEPTGNRPESCHLRLCHFSEAMCVEHRSAAASMTNDSSVTTPS
jgi:hypothetical protein